MGIWTFILTFVYIATAGMTVSNADDQLNCSCDPIRGFKNCGKIPAFMSLKDIDISKQLGFSVPEEDLVNDQNSSGDGLTHGLAKFLVMSDRARMFYPEYYTRATKNASILTLKSKYIPKNPTEMDEYFRCSIPSDKYCIYRKKLRPYIGLAAKVSGIDYSFLACQSYVESRFKHDARSAVGALGYSQIKPSNIAHMNQILKRSIEKTGGRTIASAGGPREARIRQAQKDISSLWKEFWSGTKKAPQKLCEDDLTCHRQAFLAQTLALKTDMLTFATSTKGVKAEFDENGDFRIEKMDRGDSLLLLAGSYNLGVSKMIRMVSKYCSGVSKLKKCLDQMKQAKFDTTEETENHRKDVQAILHYVMRIRDCSQQYSAEQLDFNDDDRWSDEIRTEKQNEQRDRVAQCLLSPCPYSRTPATEK